MILVINTRGMVPCVIMYTSAHYGSCTIYIKMLYISGTLLK